MRPWWLVLALGCGGPRPTDDAPTDDAPTDDDVVDDTVADDTARRVEGLTGPHVICEPPAALPADPIVADGEVSYVFNGADSSAELVDVELSGGRVYAAGQPGVLVFEDRGGVITEVGRWSGNGVTIRLEVGGDGFLYTVNDDGDAVIVDATDLGAIATVATLDVPRASSVHLRGDRLYVTTFAGALHTVDVSDPARPVALGSVTGLGVPWEIDGHGGWAWVADDVLGVVPIDLSDPDVPVIGAPLALGGTAQDLEVSDDGARAVVAGGTRGLHVIDLSTPGAPALAHTLDVGGTVVGAAVEGRHAWAVTQLDLTVHDLDAPGGPLPLATETTDGFAMHVAVDGDTAWVADWYRVARYQHDPAVRAPDLALSWRVLGLRRTGGISTSTWTNRGGAPLHLTGVRHRRGLDVSVPTDVLQPGESIEVDVAFDGQHVPYKDTFCVVSDDPDEPIQRLTVTTGLDGEGSLIGQQAPDFVLTDLDGRTHRLADQLGKPVILAYFAVW